MGVHFHKKTGYLYRGILHATVKGAQMAAKYTRFEKARIVGARAIQISCGAPVYVDDIEGLIDPIDVAMLEMDADVIPISVNYD